MTVEPAQRTAQRLARLRLPELALRDVRFVPVVAILIVVLFADPHDPDLWWHLKTGQFIIEGHRFFSSDPFSWTAAGRTWYLHEWLSEVMLYWVQSNLGFVVDILIIGGVVVAALAVVYRLALRICPREAVVAGLMALSAVLMLVFLKVRPQAFTWLFFAIFVRQLYLSYQGERVSLWPLPVLMAVWSNMHLGYLFGLMVVYIWLASLVLRDGRAGLRSLRGPALLAFACTLAPVISPIGPRAFLTPFEYALSDRVAANVISEWQSPNFHGIAFIPLLLALGVIFAAGLPLGRRHLFGFLLALAVVMLALVARRNIALLAVVLPLIVSESIAERWPLPARPPRIGVNALNWAIVGATVFAAAVAIGSFGELHAEPENDKTLPSQGVAYVREHPPGTRMFNSYGWGGYLIAKLYPDVKVSIDGRSDLYGNDILQRYLDLLNARPGWRDGLKEMDPDFIFLPKDLPLSGELLHESGWKLAFEGPIEVIFVPAGRADPESGSGPPG